MATTPGPRPDLFSAPPRPEERIDELLALLAADWKRSGSDQRFFQYIANLQHRLGLPADAYQFEDTALISRLTAGAEPRQAG